MHIQSIPIDRLQASARNVRRSGALHVDDLVASIREHGLLQNLIVATSATAGVFDVIAGSRRLTALQRLANAGDLPEGLAEGVPCQVIDVAGTDGELSLAENVIRAPMHPADQFEAFARLVDGGMSVADVAARFGVKPLFVEQRLRLSRVAGELVQLYRNGAMTLEQLEAFTVNDDHKAQLGYWRGNADTQWKVRPEEIRRGLAKGEVELARDPRGLLIGADALIAAGAQVRRDLFDSTGGFTRDVKLLDKLAIARLEAAAEPVRAEGWSYVEVLPAWEDRYQRDKLEAQARKPTAEETIERSKLVARFDELDEAERELTDAESVELEGMEDAINQFDERLTLWTDAQKAKAGAVVTISRLGSIEIHRGVLRKGQKAGRDDAAKPGKGKDGNAPEKTTADLTAALSVRLAAQRTIALRAELAARSDVALIAIVDCLARSTFYRGAASEVQISIDHGIDLARADPKIDKSPAAAEMKRLHTAWRARLPQNPSELWAWLGQAGQDTLLNLLAYCVATSVMATDHAADPKRYASTAAGLAAAVDLDMAKWWKPSVENFLGSVPKSTILAALREASAQPIIDAEHLESFKAGALAARAEPLLCNPAAVWLPPLLRSPKWKQGPAAAPAKPAREDKPAKAVSKPKAKATAKPKPKAKPAAKPKKKAKR
jgi:ParB family transcriptional regulator, chromosome partitioning protein